MRSKAAAQLALALQAGKAEEIADDCGVTVATVQRWAAGKRDPSEDNITILREHGITGSWAEAIASPKTLDALPPVMVAEATAYTTEQDALSLRTLLLTMQQKVAVLGDLEAQVRMAEKLVNMLDHLGKITGATEVNERKIVRSPAFQVVMAAFRQACCEQLTPELAGAVLRDAAERLDAIGGSDV